MTGKPEGRVLVAGGAGFIGSHVADALLARGRRVLVVDDLSKGRMENLADAAERPGFSFEKLDVVAERDRLAAVAGDVSAVVHMIARKIPRYTNGLETLLVNTEATKVLLDFARERKARFLLASTSDVYGKSADLPFTEEGDLVLGPSTSTRWAYAVSKIFDEHLALAYRDEYGIETVILRYFGAYGERQYLNWWGGPQGVFLERIFAGEPVDIHGDGEQSRCFVYVGDLAEATVRALEAPDADGEIINVGSTEEISIVGLARLMHELSGDPRPLGCNFIPYERFSRKYEDVRRRIPDLARLERITGYRPATDLRTGLSRLIAWYRTAGRRVA